MRWTAVAWTLASTADWFVLMAVMWLAAEHDWSGRRVAVLVIAARAPTLLGGLVGGRAVDRYGPRPVLAATSVVQTGVLLTMAGLGLAGDLGFLGMLVGAAVLSASEPLSYAAARTLVPRLVDDSQMAQANTWLAAGDAFPTIASSALIGPALLVAGEGAFAVPAVLTLGVLVIALALPRTEPAAAEAPTEPRHEARPRRTWLSPSVVALVALSTVYFAVYGPFQPVLPFLVRQNMDGDAGTYSLLRVSTGIGWAVGLVLGARLAGSRRPGVVNAAGAALWGLATLPLAFLHAPLAAAAVYFVSGVTWGPYAAVETTALQRWTPRSHHGRVFALQRALVTTAVPVGAAVGSLALDYVSASTIVVVSTAACVVTGLLALCLPAIRRPAGASADALLESARAAIRRLSAENGVTAALAVVEQGSLRYVGASTPEGAEDEASLGPVPHLHVASAGKALLAWTGPERVRGLGPLERFTDASITDPDTLLEQLTEARSRGYAASRGEWEADSWAVSAPVFGPADQPVAFVSLWGRLDRDQPEHLDAFGRLAQETAASLSAR